MARILTAIPHHWLHAIPSPQALTPRLSCVTLSPQALTPHLSCVILSPHVLTSSQLCHPEPAGPHLTSAVSSRAKRSSAEPRDLLLLFVLYQGLASAFFSGAEGPAFAFRLVSGLGFSQAATRPPFFEKSSTRRSREQAGHRWKAVTLSPQAPSHTSAMSSRAKRSSAEPRDLLLLFVLYQGFASAMPQPALRFSRNQVRGAAEKLP